MNALPRVTVVTPCYNGANFIGRTIESVCAQEGVAFEHVVVDDGSTDESASVVQSFIDRGEKRLRLLRKANRGVCSARQAGADVAAPSGEYLYFLDADDLIASTALNRFASYLDSHPEVGMAHCACKFVDEHDRETATGSYRPMRVVPGWIFPRELAPSEPVTPFVALFCWAPVIPSLAMIRRSVYEQTPGWDLDFGQPCEDTDLFLHIALRSEVHYIPEMLASYRRYSEQCTNDLARLNAQKRKLHRKWLQMPASLRVQRQVREAWLFYEGKYKPFLNATWGEDHFRAGNYGESISCYLRSVKQLGEYLGLRLRITSHMTAASS
jgi:glycosyltransferase involved in cell wall biosynthesis